MKTNHPHAPAAVQAHPGINAGGCPGAVKLKRGLSENLGSSVPCIGAVRVKFHPSLGRGKGGWHSWLFRIPEAPKTMGVLMAFLRCRPAMESTRAQRKLGHRRLLCNEPPELFLQDQVTSPDLKAGAVGIEQATTASSGWKKTGRSAKHRSAIRKGTCIARHCGSTLRYLELCCRRENLRF